METSSQDGVLKVENLYYSFSENDLDVQVLSGVSLLAKKGEITSIVGPSGCGKSTLLYLMGLLDHADSGKISMDGQEMQDLNDRKRTVIRNQKIGFVFQFHFLIKELNALENIRLPLLKSGTDRKLADDKALELISELGLEDKWNRPAYKLSGGEQQRVAIARSLVNSPSYLLADEPTGNLDSKNSEMVFDLLLKFASEKGIAVVLVTHNDKLSNLSDQTLRMMDGQILI